MTKTKPVRKYLRDDFVTKILTAKDCKEYLAAIINKILGKNLSANEYNLKDIRINSKKVYKNSEADVVRENRDSILDIEINYCYDKESDIKNITYICQLILGQTKPTKKFKYVTIKPCYQINICNYDYFKEDKFIYKSTLRLENSDKLRTDLMYIYDVNLDYLGKMDYTDIVETYGKDSLEQYLSLFLCTNREEVSEICKGSEIMEPVKENIFGYEVDDFGWTREEVIRKQFEGQIFSEGVEQGKEETAIAMLKDNMSLELIAKYSGLTIDDIKEIQKEISNDEKE